METTELRKKVIEYVNQADEDTLRVVNDVIENYIFKKIVAYSSQGKPLSKEDYIESIKTADASMDNGEFISVEDLENEVRDW